MQCFKPAWDRGFTKDLNMKGWRIEGLIPFNRNAYWRKKGATTSTTSLAIRAYTGHNGVEMSISPAYEGEQATARDEDEDDDAPAPMLRMLDPLAPGSEGLQEAIAFVNTDEVQQPSYDHLLAYTQELKGSSRLLDAKFVAASAAQSRAPERTRIYI